MDEELEKTLGEAADDTLAQELPEDARPQGHDDPQATHVSEDPTTDMPSVGDAPERDEASLRDVRDVAGSYARGRLARLQAFFAGHLLATAVACCAALVVILAAVLFARSLADTPDVELITRDARDRLAHASYQPDLFDATDQLVLSSVDVASRHKESGAPHECTVSVMLTYGNGSIECVQSATMEYALQDGAWNCVDVSRANDAVYTAAAGVSDQALLAHVDELLRKAETTFAEGGSSSSELSLPTLYRNAEIAVTDRNFDSAAQTYDARVHLSRSATFTAYECDLTASLVFRQGNGKWELTTVQASPGAKEVVLTPLIGTWTGTFVSQTATESKCFGAKQEGVRVAITSADAGHISGTLTCLAHYHAVPDGDVDASEGDATFTEEAFTGTVDASSSGISFTCTTAEDARGTVSLRLDFGSPDDPDAATATVTTSYAYEDVFLFVPFQHEVSYSDVFSITKD